MLGTYVLSHGYYDAYYNKAKKLRFQIENEFLKVFNPPTGGVDAIATPTTPAPAFKIGEKSKDPVQMYLSDIFTVSANIAGVPAISIPAGINKDNLPLDLHLTAPHFREDILFEIGKKFESL
jgi:aspartyl-tRNA(Asn)/glutamyl-tRNA(Gln) amidotransferase subunit A